MTDLGGIRVQTPLRGILHEVRDRLLSIGLGGADEADGATLDPAGRIHAGDNGGGLVLRGVTLDDAALNVGHDAGALIEGQARNRRRVVAHRAVHGLHRPRRDDARARHGSIAVQGGAFGAQGLHVAVLIGDDLDRGLEQVNVNATRGRVLLGVDHRVGGQGLDDLTLLVRRAQRLLRTLIEVEVLFRNDDVDVRHLAQLAQLQRRELDLRGAAATEHVYVGDRVLRQGLGDVGGDLGLEHVLGVLSEHARHVQRHVADAEDRNLAGLQRPRARVVRVAVVPGHEVGGTVGLGQVDAGDVERVVAIRTGCDNDRIVVVAQVVDGDVAADLDVAEQADVAALEDLVEGDDDLLDARMVGGHTVAHEAVRRGKPLKQVDIHLESRLRQNVRRVDASGTGADDGNVERCQASSPSS